MIPLFESLSKLVPVIEPTIVQPIQDSLLYYKDLQSKAQAASAPSTAPATAAPAPAVVAPAPAAQPQQRQPAAPKK